MTDAATAPVQLDDLAEPHFAPEAEPMREMMGALAPDCPLDADALHARATADTGLDDFGPDDYRERLDVYLAALHEIDGMTGAGGGQLLLAAVAVAEEPAAAHRSAASVIPRSTTSNCCRRSSSRACPAPGPPICTTCSAAFASDVPHACRTGRASSRFRCRRRPASSRIPVESRMDMAVGFMHMVMPHFPLMHEMTTDHVHEEIQLLANDFSSMLMETLGHVPALARVLHGARPDLELRATSPPS